MSHHEPAGRPMAAGASAPAPRRAAAVLAGATLLLVAPLQAGADPAPGELDPSPGALQILQRAEKIRSPELDYAVEFTLEAIDPNSSWKERTARYAMIAHGKDYSYVLMREPAMFHPGTLLIREGLYWLLLPRSQTPFQLAPRHILNGDIANGDLARGNLLAFYDVRLDGEEVVRDEPCWRLELTRNRNLAMYPRIVCWITKGEFRPWKFDYYGETGTLLKVAYYEDYRATPLGIRSMRIRVENRTRPGEKTVLTFENLRSLDSSKLDFSPAAMTAFRDAALAKLEADGVQASAEDLLAALGAPGP